MGDLPRRVPGTAGGQFRLFKQNRFSPPSFVAQMISEANAHDATTDNDNAGMGREILRQGFIHYESISLDTLSEQKYHGQS